MVWSFCPVDPVSGDEKYFIFSKGTYTVGRRGCDVIVKNDKSVSRVHAEIVIDSMPCLPHRTGKSGFMIKDSSKYGTFITKKNAIKEKIHEHLTKTASLEDGDVVSFGTGSAIYKLSFVPLVFHHNSTKHNASLSYKIASFGGRCTDHLSKECTHFIIDESQPINEDLLDGIIKEKHFVRQNWVESLAENRIASEFPNCISNLAVNIDGIATTIADTKTRSNFMHGYTCILDSTAKYKFAQNLPNLLRISGASVVYTEDLCSSSQILKEDEKNKMLCIVPSDSSMFNSNITISFQRLKEADAIRAILSAHLDVSCLISPPPVLISSSCSTGETIVADSDEETLTVTSEKFVTNISNQKDETRDPERPPPSYVSPAKETTAKPPIRNGEDGVLEHLNSDIIFSQSLITRESKAAPLMPSNSEVPNFKTFRKKMSSSGNEFGCVIPFSKNPYSDADYENKETRESLREEKKRKQREAVAEDLFNNDKKRQKGVAGALRGLLLGR